MTVILASSAPAVFLTALLLVAMQTSAEDEELPEMAFLEYLGMWQDTDEEWLLLDEDAVADNVERTDPAPEGKESMETRDES